MTQPYPEEQRNVVKQVGVGKGDNTEDFAELWTLTLRESETKEFYCEFFIRTIIQDKN